MTAILNNQSNTSSTEVILLERIALKVVNFASLGLFTTIFASADTYKSISVTIEFLAINSIIYEYSFIYIAKYIAIHIVSSVISAFISVGIYYDLVKSVSTSFILANTIPSSRLFAFNYSYVLVSCLMHMGLSVGLTILTNTTTSINAYRRAMHKTALLCFISLIFGVVVDPVGYVWPNLALYTALVIVRGEYDLYNIDILITSLTSLVAIVVAYPMIATYIKYVLRNKYLKYIEY